MMIRDRTPLKNRPQAANERSEIGHWAADTAISRDSTATIVVL